MVELEEILNLISLKQEGGYWDFKKEWYKKHEKQDLLHDIICMANNIENHAEAKIDLQIKFWENLEVGLKERLKDKYNIEYQDTFENSKLGEVNPKYSKDIIRRFHTTRRGSTNQLWNTL